MKFTSDRGNFERFRLILKKRILKKKDIFMDEVAEIDLETDQEKKPEKTYKFDK